MFGEQLPGGGKACLITAAFAEMRGNVHTLSMGDKRFVALPGAEVIQTFANKTGLLPLTLGK